MESQSFHDVGQGANQESKAQPLFPVGPASKQSFLQAGHSPGSSNMGTLEEGSEGGDEPRQCDPVATCIYILWRIRYLGTNSYSSRWAKMWSFFYSYTVCLALKMHSDKSSPSSVTEDTCPHSVNSLIQGTLQLHRLWGHSLIMTSWPFRLPNEDSPPSGNMEFIMCISRVVLHSVCIINVEGRRMVCLLFCLQF